MDATIRIEAGQVRPLLGQREAKLSIPYNGSTPLGHFHEVEAAVDDLRFLAGRETPVILELVAPASDLTPIEQASAAVIKDRLAARSARWLLPNAESADVVRPQSAHKERNHWDPRFLHGASNGQLTISIGSLELTADGRTTKQVLPTHGRMLIVDFPILVDAIIRARNVVGLRRKALVDVVAIGAVSNLERQAISEALTEAGLDGSLVRMPIPVESHSYVPSTLSKMLFWIFIVIVMLLAVRTFRSIWIVAPIWLVAFACLEAYSHFQEQRSRHDRLQSAWNIGS